jgi:hypothetical protein
MIIKLNRKINGANGEFTIDERDEDKALEMMTFLSVEDYCNNCGAREGILWQSNRASTDKGEFLYTKRRCLKCSATSGIGKYKTGGMFWKKFEVFEGSGDQIHQSSPKKAVDTPQNASQAKSNDAPHPADDVDISDIPF